MGYLQQIWAWITSLPSIYFEVAGTIAIALGAVVLLYRALRKPRPDPVAAPAAPSEDDGSPESRPATIASFIIGAVFSGSVGVFMWYWLGGVLEGMLPKASYPAMNTVQPLVAIVCGLIMTVLLFSAGFFNIPVMNSGYASLLGQPFRRFVFGTGYGWWPFQNFAKWFGNVTIDEVRESHLDIGRAVYTSGDGMDVGLNAGMLYRVYHPLLKERITDGSVEHYLDAKLRAAIQTYLLEIKAEFAELSRQIALAAKTTLAPEALETLLKNFSAFKGGIPTKGAIRIRHIVNYGMPGTEAGADGTMDRGIYVPEIQIKDVELPKELDAGIKAVFTELVQAISLPQDAANKARQVAIIMDVYKDLMTPEAFQRLPGQVKRELISEAYRLALAREGQAQVHQYNFGGTPPRGFVVPQGGGHKNHGDDHDHH